MADPLTSAVVAFPLSAATNAVVTVPNLIGFAASLITATQVSRQAFDAWRVPDPTGVSWLTWDIALLQSAGLLALSVSRDYLPAEVINAFVGLASVVIVVRVLGTRHSSPALGPAVAVASTLVVCGAVLLAAGATAAGTLGSIASAFVWVPQAVHSVRTRSPIGLSWVVVLTGLASSALWLWYAVAVDQWRLLIPPSSAILSLVVTACYALWHHDKDPSPDTNGPAPDPS